MVLSLYKAELAGSFHKHDVLPWQEVHKSQQNLWFIVTHQLKYNKTVWRVNCTHSVVIIFCVLNLPAYVKYDWYYYSRLLKNGKSESCKFYSMLLNIFFLARSINVKNEFSFVPRQEKAKSECSLFIWHFFRYANLSRSFPLFLEQCVSVIRLFIKRFISRDGT